MLNDDKKTKDFLKSFVKEYNEKIKACKTPKERGVVQNTYRSALENNQDYQRLVNCYPHNSDSRFTKNPLIGEICTRIMGNLTVERIDQLVNSLREEYANIIKDIKQDFVEKKITFVNYDIANLISKNPTAMQSVFRQQALIKQEDDNNDVVKGGNIALKVAMLHAYKEERNNKTNNQYFSGFGFLSRPFGAWSKNEKFKAVDALIKYLESPEDNPAYLKREYLGPLQQGTLGRLTQRLGVDLNSMLEHNEGSVFIL